LEKIRGSKVKKDGGQPTKREKKADRKIQKKGLATKGEKISTER